MQLRRPETEVTNDDPPRPRGPRASVSRTESEPGEPPRSGVLRFARMAGSSIAGRDAAPWVTDFLNAAYYRRPPAEREVDDLRLAFCVLTTYWYRTGPARRLRVDRPRRLPSRVRRRALRHRGAPAAPQPRAAARRRRARCSATGSRRPTPTTRAAAGASRSATVEERDAYDPARRLALAAAGRAHAPRRAPPDEQVWHTYPPVEMPSAEARHRRAHAAGDLARLRERDRPLHAAAPGRPAGPDVRDRGRRRHRAPGRPCSRAATSRSPRWSRRTTRRRCAPGSTRSRTAWPATARTSRAWCPRAASRSSAST